MKKNNFTDKDINNLKESINLKLIQTGIASIAIAVAKDGEVIWEEGFGWANRERRIKASAHTMYSIASITKPMTATGIMILKEHGLLELDRSINEYLGEAKVKAYVGNADNATIRKVANHTSGLPLHYQFFYEDEPYSKPPMDETIRRYANLLTAPGEKYQYSNLGYGLLDYVISRLSGKSYRDFMREEVFIPLNMTRASINIEPYLEEFVAIRYGTDGHPIPFYDFDHPGGSAAFCSAHDLVRFGMFHLKTHLSDQRAILSDESIDEMQIGTAEIGNNKYYGIGWAICDNVMGYRCIWHNGGMGGVSTTLKLFPEEKIVIVVLSNSSSDLPEIISNEALSLLLPKYAEEHSESENRMDDVQKKTGNIFPSEELIGTWEGIVHTYKRDIPVTFWIKDSGDIHVKMGDQLKVLLNDVSFKDDTLTGKMVGDIGTEDANRLPYHLHVSLKLRGKILNGAMMAISLPMPRLGNALSHWMELERK
ncbi:MAG: serine hydrolase domain-containing protein [bacterium]